MRRAAPVTRPVVLTVAGSDSGGGAGIQADIKTIEAHGCFATSALTAVTAQHTRGVERIDVLESEAVRDQIDAVIEDLEPAAIKTGMLATTSITNTVSDAIAGFDGPVVVDPVMVAASGDRLLDRAAEDAYWTLFDHATVVTPNADEAEVLTGTDVTDEDSAINAGRAVVADGPVACLVKGGHWGQTGITDTLVQPGGVETYTHPRIDTDATHGSGCTLASAIAAGLAEGDDLSTAVADAIAFMGRAVRYHHDIGAGPGAVNHLAELHNNAAVRTTLQEVRSLVEQLIDDPAMGAIVPEVGMNVVGALPAAEAVQETAAVDGRIVRTVDGPTAVGDVRLGASGHVARLLLAAREHEPALRFAANCRSDDATAAAIDRLEWPAVHLDRSTEPEAVGDTEGRTMPWVAKTAFEEGSRQPVAIYDDGDIGKEPMTRILATDVDHLRDRLTTLATEVAST